MRQTVSCESRTSAPNGVWRGSENRLPHCWHFQRWTLLRPFPAFTVSILQLWQVTVKSPVEFHSQKPDTKFGEPCGFGCAIHFPGEGSSLHRGAKLTAGKGFEPLDDVWASPAGCKPGCVRPLCQPAERKSCGQRTRTGDRASLAICL